MQPDDQRCSHAVHTHTHTHTQRETLCTIDLLSWALTQLSSQSVLQHCRLDGADEGHLSDAHLFPFSSFLLHRLTSALSASASSFLPPLSLSLHLWLNIKASPERLCDQSCIVDNDSPVSVTAAPSICTQTDTRLLQTRLRSVCVCVCVCVCVFVLTCTVLMYSGFDWWH